MELESLSAELEALGGGAAIVSRYKVLAYAGPPQGRTSSCTLRTRDGRILVRDPRAPSDTPIAQCERSFEVPHFVSAGDNGDAFYTMSSEGIIENLLKGFNCTVMAFGQTGVGKTHQLHGHMAWPACSIPGPACLVNQIIRDVLERTAESYDDFQVGLSCWELWQDNVVDLLASSPPLSDQTNAQRLNLSSTPGLTLEHLCLRLESLADVDVTLAFARTRSANWGCTTPGGPVVALSNRAHSFTRVVIHHKRKGWLSLLHIVDLAGFQPISGARTKLVPVSGDQQALDSEREQRHRSQQLLSVTRLLTDLASVTSKAGSGCTPGASPLPRPRCARDSKLSQMLTPLIAGNAHVTLIAAVSPDAADFLDTCNTLRLAARSRSTCTGVMRNSVRSSDLHILPMWQMLPPEALQLASAQKQAHAAMLSALEDPSPSGAADANRTTGSRSHARHTAQHRAPVQASSAMSVCHERSTSPAREHERDGGSAHRRLQDSEQSTTNTNCVKAQHFCLDFQRAFEPEVAVRRDAAHQQWTPGMPAAMDSPRGAQHDALTSCIAPESPVAPAQVPGDRSHAASQNRAASEVQYTPSAPTAALREQFRALYESIVVSDTCGEEPSERAATEKPAHQTVTVTGEHVYDPPMRSFEDVCLLESLANASALNGPFEWPSESGVIRKHPYECSLRSENSVAIHAVGGESGLQHAQPPQPDFRLGRGLAASDSGASTPEPSQGVSTHGTLNTLARDHMTSQSCQAAPSTHEAVAQNGAAAAAAAAATTARATLPAGPLCKSSGASPLSYRQLHSHRASDRRLLSQSLLGLSGGTDSQQPHGVHTPDGGCHRRPEAQPATPGATQPDFTPQDSLLSRLYASVRSSTSPPRRSHAPEYSDASPGLDAVPAAHAAMHSPEVAAYSISGHRGDGDPAASLRTRSPPDPTTVQRSAHRDSWDGPDLHAASTPMPDWLSKLDATRTAGGPTSVGAGGPMPGARAMRCGDSDTHCARHGTGPSGSQAAEELRRGRAMLRVVDEETGSLRKQNEGLLQMVDRERSKRVALEDSIRELKADLVEMQTAFEVKLDTERLKRVEAERLVQKIQAASDFSDVFEHYEHDMRRLRSEANELKQENAMLLRSAASGGVDAFVAPASPRASQAAPQSPSRLLRISAARCEHCGALNTGCPPSASLDEQRFQRLRRQLKRTEAEKEAAQAELDAYAKKERSYTLARRQLAICNARIEELEKRSQAREKRVLQQGLAAQAAQGQADLSHLKVAQLQQEVAHLTESNQQLDAQARALASQVQLLSKNRRRHDVLSKLPALPAPAAGASKCGSGVAARGGVAATPAGMLDLAQQMKRTHLPPKTESLLDRLIREIQFSVEDRKIRQHREHMLLNIVEGKD